MRLALALGRGAGPCSRVWGWYIRCVTKGTGEGTDDYKPGSVVVFDGSFDEYRERLRRAFEADVAKGQVKKIKG